MDKRKWKPFMKSDKTDEIANNDAHIGIRVDLASQLGLALSTLNTNVKNHEASGRNYEGHSKIKERFAIKKYLLIKGKKKNMHRFYHTPSPTSPHSHLGH
jgi:hypothetical protein